MLTQRRSLVKAVKWLKRGAMAALFGAWNQWVAWVTERAEQCRLMGVALKHMREYELRSHLEPAWMLWCRALDDGGRLKQMMLLAVRHMIENTVTKAWLAWQA